MELLTTKEECQTLAWITLTEWLNHYPSHYFTHVNVLTWKRGCQSPGGNSGSARWVVHVGNQYTENCWQVVLMATTLDTYAWSARDQLSILSSIRVVFHCCICGLEKRLTGPLSVYNLVRYIFFKIQLSSFIFDLCFTFVLMV